MVVATSEGFAFWDPMTNQMDPIASPEAGKEGARFNDGKVDRQGRFWAGTMTPEGATSSLYRLDPDLTVHKMESGVTISNGVGWSPDNRLMYFVDTMVRVINVYDFDADTGAISNKRIFYQIAESDGVPDGLTIDAEGYIWCALCMGWKVIRIAPSGDLDVEIKMPIWLPTSCAFGGKNLDELYVTTGWVTMSESSEKTSPIRAICCAFAPMSGAFSNRNSRDNQHPEYDELSAGRFLLALTPYPGRYCLWFDPGVNLFAQGIDQVNSSPSIFIWMVYF